MMSTIDVKQGLVSVRYSEKAQKDVLFLLEDLSSILKKEHQADG